MFSQLHQPRLAGVDWSAQGGAPKRQHTVSGESVEPGSGFNGSLGDLIGRDVPQMGTNANSRITIDVKVRPFDPARERNYTRNIQKGDWLWCFKHVTTPASKSPFQLAHTYVTTHVLNYLLHKLAVESKPGDEPTIESVSRDFTLAGVCVSDTTEFAQKNGERTLAAIRHGDYEVHNVWDRSVTGQDQLWFLVMRVPLDGSYREYRPMSDGFIERLPTTKQVGKSATMPLGSIIQIVPAITRRKFVPREMLRTVLNDGSVSYGYAVRLGYCDRANGGDVSQGLVKARHNEANIEMDRKDGTVDALKQMSAPTFTMKVNIG